MRPSSGRRIFGDQSQQRGLARAVRADQADNFFALRASKLTRSPRSSRRSVLSVVHCEERLIAHAILVNIAVEDKFPTGWTASSPGGPIRWRACARRSRRTSSRSIASRSSRSRGGRLSRWREVLVRMREEETALLPPGEFLPVFEHYRMMPQLDRWVVRNALRHLARGSRIPRFTVNISSQTLKDAEFPAFAEAELRAASAPLDGAAVRDRRERRARAPEAAARFAAAMHGSAAACCRRLRPPRGVVRGAREVRADFVKVDGSITRKMLTSEAARNQAEGACCAWRNRSASTWSPNASKNQDVLARLRELSVGFAQGFGVWEAAADRRDRRRKP